jgi:glycosyltransferase involved in cell wall biosynthesis
MERQKLSAYVICYNNEDKIRDCLESVKWADEVVVVDSFSTDKTAQIAKEYTDKIYQVKFEGFGKLRNTALSFLKHDWVLSVDTDERATPELRKEIIEKLQSSPDADAYYVPRISHFLKYRIRHCGWYPDYRQPQFFNRHKMKYKDQLVHETYELDGKIGYLKEHCLQYPFFTIDQFFSKMERYSALRAKEMTKEGKKFHAYNLVINPLSMFFRMYVMKAGFLDGLPGFILSCLYGYYTFIKYVRLWEINNS